MNEQIVLAIIVFLASTGFVVLVHTSPMPIPNFKPFNCAFCAIVWIAWAIWGTMEWMHQEYRVLNLLLAMIYPFAAGLIVGHYPWLFRTFASPALQQEPGDTTKAMQDFSPTDEQPPSVRHP